MTLWAILTPGMKKWMSQEDTSEFDTAAKRWIRTLPGISREWYYVRVFGVREPYILCWFERRRTVPPYGIQWYVCTLYKWSPGTEQFIPTDEHIRRSTRADAEDVIEELRLKYDIMSFDEPVPPIAEPECKEGDVKPGFVCSGGKWVTRVCTEGAKRGKETCWDGSVIYKEVCAGSRWAPTGQTCPDPAPTIRRLQGKVRTLEAQVADLQRKITDLKTRYGI